MNIKRIDWKYLLAEAGLLLLFCYLFLFAGFTDVFFNMNVIWVLAILVTIIGVVILLTKKPGAVPLSLPILLFFLSCILSTFFSFDPRRSVDQLYFFALTGFVFVASVQLVRSGIKEQLITKTILLAGFLTSIVLFLNAALWYRQWLQSSPGVIIPTISYRLPSSNIMIMFLNPLLFLLISMIFSSKSRTWKVLLCLDAVFVAFLIFLTSSRGGWAGTVAGLLVLLLLSGKAGWIKWAKILRWLKSHKLVVIGIALVAIMIVGGIIFLLLRQSAHPTHRAVSEARAEFWPPAWNAFLEHPLVGQGLFTFNTSLLRTQSVPPFKIFVHAHSIPINTLAEMGVVGEAALIFLVVSVVFAFWKRFFKYKIGEPSILMAAVAAFVGASVHGLFDCYNQPFGFWLVIILIGCALAKPIPEKNHWYHRQYWLIMFIPIVWVNLWLLNGYNKGIVAADNKDIPTTITELENSERIDPYSAAIHQQLALAYSMDPIRVSDSINELEKAIELDPDWALNYANLGALYMQKGDLQKAFELMRSATEKAPDCALFHLNLGFIYEQMGEETSARSEYQAYLTAMPEFSESLFWTQTLLRTSIQQDWRLANTSPDYSIEEAMRSINENPNEISGYILAARLEMESGSLEQAENYLRLARMVYTTRPWKLMEVYWMQASIAAFAGDHDKAVQLAETALDYYRYQDVGGPGNLHGMLYINLAFRKPAMRNVLMPGLIKNPFPNTFGPYMEKLMGWYEAIGDSFSAERIRTELVQYIPEYTFGDQP